MEFLFDFSSTKIVPLDPSTCAERENLHVAPPTALTVGPAPLNGRLLLHWAQEGDLGRQTNDRNYTPKQPQGSPEVDSRPFIFSFFFLLFRFFFQFIIVIFIILFSLSSFSLIMIWHWAQYGSTWRRGLSSILSVADCFSLSTLKINLCPIIFSYRIHLWYTVRVWTNLQRCQFSSNLSNIKSLKDKFKVAPP